MEQLIVVAAVAGTAVIFVPVFVFLWLRAKRKHEAFTAAARTLGLGLSGRNKAQGHVDGVWVTIDFDWVRPPGVTEDGVIKTEEERIAALGEIYKDSPYPELDGKRCPQFRVRYPDPNLAGLDLELRIIPKPKNSWEQEDKIDIGDKAFEDKFQVEGKNAEAVREYLTPARRAHIAAVLTRFPRAILEEGDVFWICAATEDPNKLVSTVRDLVNAVREPVESHGGQAAG